MPEPMRRAPVRMPGSTGQADDAVAMATSAAIAVIDVFGGTGGQGGCDENRPRCGFMNDGGNGLAAFLVVFRAGLGLSDGRDREGQECSRG